MRQDVRFHVRRLELEAIHVNAFEMIYPFDVTDLRGHSFVFFSCARARVCFYDFIIRAARVVATCFPAALKLRLFVCQSLACALLASRVVCVCLVFLAATRTYSFFFPILRQRKKRESEIERRRAHTHHTRTHKHKDREKNDDDER